MLTRTLLAAIALAATSSANAVLVYDADFSEELSISHSTSTGGAPAAPGSLVGPNWTVSWSTSPTTDGSSNFIESDGSTLNSADWGGAASFATATIDVSSYDSVDITAIAQTVGGSVFNNSAEFFQWSYSLDGTTTSGSLIKADGSLDFSELSIDTTSATDLIVGFDFNVNGGGDGWSVSSLTVNGTLAAIPEPSAALFGSLLAGALGLTVGRRSQEEV